MKKKNKTIVIFHFLALNSFAGEVVQFFFFIYFKMQQKIRIPEKKTELFKQVIQHTVFLFFVVLILGL